MKRFYPLALVAILLSVGLSPAAPQKDFVLHAAQASFSYQLRYHLLIVEATVDDQHGYFVFDTGASGLTLNQARFSSYPLLRRGYSHTALKARQDGWGIRVNYFEWGKLSRRRFVARVDDLRLLERKVGLPLLGLIGHQVIRDLEIRIVPQEQCLMLLQLDENGHPLPGYSTSRSDLQVIPFQMNGHLPIISLPTQARKPLRLGLDSGSTINVLDEDWKSTLLPWACEPRPIKIADVANLLQPGESFVLENLILAGAIPLQRWRATFLDLDHLQLGGARMDGLMNFEPLLQQSLSINYHKRELSLWKEI